jgi:hypothetical protein
MVSQTVENVVVGDATHCVDHKSLHCQVEHHVHPKKLYLVSCITKMGQNLTNLFS